MTPFDRKVRAGIYRLFVDEVRTVDAGALAETFDWDVSEVFPSRLDRRVLVGHLISLRR